MDETNNAANENESPRTTAGSAEQHVGNVASAVDAKFSGPLAPLESALDGVFGKKAPYQLPTDLKDLLVKIAPWLSLIAGLLGLLSVYFMWQAVRNFNRASDYVNQMYGQFGMPETNMSGFTLMFWLSIVMILVYSALAFLSFPGLRAKKKVGWNFMFYSMLANVAYGVVSLFYANGGFGSLLSALIMSAIGFYILFQIRDRYSV